MRTLHKSFYLQRIYIFCAYWTTCIWDKGWRRVGEKKNIGAGGRPNCLGEGDVVWATVVVRTTRFELWTEHFLGRIKRKRMRQHEDCDVKAWPEKCSRVVTTPFGWSPNGVRWLFFFFFFFFFFLTYSPPIVT